MHPTPYRPGLPAPCDRRLPYPPPVILDAEMNDSSSYYYPQGPYPPPAYPPPVYSVPAYPPSPYGPPPPPRRGPSWRLAAILLLVAFAGVGLWLAGKQPPPSAGTAPWWQGSWTPNNGEDAPRLELKSTGRLVTGWLILGFTGGYLMRVPLLDSEANEAAVLFAVEGRPPQRVTFYLLEWQGFGTAALYRLRPPPPGRPYTARLLPRAAGQNHILLATLVRPGATGALRLDSPPAAEGRDRKGTDELRDEPEKRMRRQTAP